MTTLADRIAEPSRRNGSQRYLKLTRPEDIFLRIESRFATYVPRVESVQVDSAQGRISAKDVVSNVNIPAKPIAAMDGYAVRSSDLGSALPERPCLFAVNGSINPGFAAELPFVGPGEAYYVATGAPIPRGADVVVRVEEARSQGGRALIRRPVPKGDNIASKGEDIREGQIVVRKGQVLDPIDVALLIGVGRAQIKTYKVPVVGLLSVGNELKEFAETLRTGSRVSGNQTTNNYLNLVSGYVERFGATAISLGVCADDPRRIQRAVLAGFKKCDAIFTIGGSSVGRRDNVLDALEAITGSATLFHGVRVVPIRPAGVVMIGGRPVVIIPGHAVSALLTFFVIGLPILNSMSGLAPLSRKTLVCAEVKTGITNERAIDSLHLVKFEVDRRGGGANYKAVALGWGSNLLSNLSKADGFIWLSPHEAIAAGQSVTVQVFAGNPIAKSVWGSPRR